MDQVQREEIAQKAIAAGHRQMVENVGREPTEAESSMALASMLGVIELIELAGYEIVERRGAVQ